MAEEGTERPPRSRSRKWLKGVLVTIVVIPALAYGAIGWIVSGQIMDGFRATVHIVEYDTDVIAVTMDEITIGVSDEIEVPLDTDTVMGLRWEGGYGQMGPAISAAGGTETRPFTLLSGTLPPVGEDVADYDSFAFPRTDPSALGLDFETVTYPGPNGDLEAWLIAGDRTTWVVAVHGLGAGRTEMLRLMRSLEGAGYPILAVTYRNDPGAPAANDSLILWGQEEHPDVAAAVDFALANGATDIVLYGPSTGGALSLAYAMSDHSDSLSGMILEAPVADFREVVRLRSGEALPVGGIIGDSLLAVSRLIVSIRSGLDFDAVDYVERAAELDVPILLFHGADDPRVPIAVSESLSRARPDLVDFRPVADAAHIRAWNEEPEAFASAVLDFLTRVGRG